MEQILAIIIANKLSSTTQIVVGIFLEKLNPKVIHG